MDLESGSDLGMHDGWSLDVIMLLLYFSKTIKKLLIR